MKAHILFVLKLAGILTMAAASINLLVIFWFMSSRNWICTINANYYGEAYLEVALVSFSALCSIPIMCEYVYLSFKRMYP